MALFCPVTLHLLAPDGAEGASVLARALRHEHIAIVYAAASPAAERLARELGGVLDVSVRVDADLDVLDVAGLTQGGRPSRHGVEALESIADLHRGEHVVVVGGVPGPDGLAVRRCLEIGDDGWTLLPERAES